MVEAQSSYDTIELEGFDLVRFDRARNYPSTDELSFFDASLRNLDSPADLNTRKYDMFVGTESGVSTFTGNFNGWPFTVKNSDFDSSGEALFQAVITPSRTDAHFFKAFAILQKEDTINYDFLMYTTSTPGPALDVFIKRVDQSFGPDVQFDISKTISAVQRFFGYDVIPIFRKTDLVGYDIIMVYEPL